VNLTILTWTLKLPETFDFFNINGQPGFWGLNVQCWKKGGGADKIGRMVQEAGTITLQTPGQY
jgi:hypothetical protein